jgi:hypothetical protein
MNLLQDIRAAMPPGMTRPIGVKPEGSKLDRMAAQSAKIEAGHVHLPNSAAWLGDFLTELLSHFQTVVMMIRLTAFPSSFAGCKTTCFKITSAFTHRSSSPDRGSLFPSVEHRVAGFDQQAYKIIIG